MEALRLLWGRLGAQSHAQRGSGRPKVASDRAAGGVRRVIWRYFGRLYGKSHYFLKCMQKTKEKHGFSRVREGPGTQVGGTWAPKSCPRGVRTATMTSNRAAGGVRTFIFRSFGRLYSKSCYFLKCMKNLRKSVVFQGLERVRAPKAEPLGSKSRAQRGSGRAKGASDRAAGGVRTVIWRSFGRLYSKSCNFLKCMKNLRKSKVFEGSERVRAPKLERLGPKSRARRRSERPNIAPEGQVRGVRTVKFGRSIQSVCRSYGNHAQIIGTQKKQRSKPIYANSRMIRSSLSIS